MKFKLFSLFFFLIYPSFLNSHESHYNKIKSIEMDVLRNGKKIGYNKYIFINKNDSLIIENQTNFIAKIVGFNLLSVNASSTETYKNGKLAKYKSETIQNKKKNTVIWFLIIVKKFSTLRVPHSAVKHHLMLWLEIGGITIFSNRKLL